jgi:small subunit ribosomal protein S4
MTPVLKRCRALGIEPAYMGLDKKSKRNARAGRKPSEYALQLKEKQKAKFIYGVLEKPFRNNFAKAQKLKYGTTGENLMILLELRLDNVIFRMGYGRTRKEARQIVGHKHVLVNGKCVNIPSYTVKPGDTIEIKEKVKGYQRYKDILETTEGRLIPDWLEANHETMTGTIKDIPTREQIDVPVNEVLIVELYSK